MDHANSASPRDPNGLTLHALAAGLARAAALGAALVLVAPAFAQDRSPSVPNDFSEMVEEKLPAVVGILSTAELPAMQWDGPQLPPGLQEFFGLPQPPQAPDGDGATRRMQSQGSGFIISADGYVVTNNHVVQGAEEIQVVFDDGRQSDAELVGADPATDIALLRVDGMDDFATVEWGNSEALRIGEWVVAIGNPFGLGGTVTAGILSARSRDIQAGPHDDFLQTDAPINRGNSGGPLFDAEGMVIGVNTAIFSPSGGSVGIGFAVPSRVAQNVVAQLRDTGRVERGWLGVQLQPLTDAIAEAVGVEADQGALIADVTSGSPAAEAGLEPGDVITEVDGTPVASPRDLSFAVAGLTAGTQADFRVIRTGEERTVTVKIGERPLQETAAAQPQGEQGGPRLGLSLAPLDAEMRDRLGINGDVSGVLVTGLENGSPAAEAGVRRGDVIVEAEGTDIAAPQDLAEIVETADTDGDATILMRIYRDGTYAYSAAKLGASDG